MLVLLIAYSIGQSGFSEAAPISSIESRDPSACDGAIQTRSILDIVWSCLFTIFLCTWGSVHPNISSIQEGPGTGWFRRWLWNPLVGFLTYKLPLFLWALLVPEYILAWAIRQYITAGKIQRKSKVPGWTRTHGFFLIMGGFQLFQVPSQRPGAMDTSTCQLMSPSNPQEHGRFVRILNIEDMLQHKLKNIVPFTTEDEIKDKGKSDGIAKAIVLLQTSWFITQCIARRITHLPLTQLEIVTLAYTMMNFVVYVFWWHKPRDVGCPIRVYETVVTSPGKAVEGEPGIIGMLRKIVVYIIGGQDLYISLSRQRKVPMFWSGGWSEEIAFGSTLGPSIFGIAFGAIHFIAWSYEFPSHAEFILWRMSCIAMLAVPLLSTVVCGFGFFKVNRNLLGWTLQIFLILLALSAWLYIVARVATIAMAFTTLRSLPSDALRGIDWTTFFPHV